MNDHHLLRVVIIALAVRLLFFTVLAPWDTAEELILHSDSLGYHELALSILNGSFSIDGALNAIRTPGYPAFIALFYWAFGPIPAAVIFVQCLLDSLVVIVIYKSIQDPKIAFSAALIYAFNPISVFFANTLMSDTLLVLTVASAFYLRERRIAGVATGIAALIKPVALYLPMVFVAWYLYRRQWKMAIWIVIIHAVIVSPWMYRNYVQFDTFAISSSQDYNLLALIAAPVMASGDRITTREAHQKYESTSENPFTKASEDKKTAISYLVEHPRSAIKGVIFGYIRSFANLNTRGIAKALGSNTERLKIDDDLSGISYFKSFWQQRQLIHFTIGIVVAAYLISFYLSSVSGLFFYSGTWLGILIAGYFIALGGVGGAQRFLMPALPFMAVSSAYALYRFPLFLGAWRRGNLKRRRDF